jgi:hypothetical protein
VAKPGDPLQQKVDALQAGDTLRLQAGVYHQSVVIRGEHIALEGEHAQFSGLRKLALIWQATARGFKAVVDHPVRQLFLNGELLTPARWPDMRFAER